MRIAVSSSLLGNKVRFDSTHIHDHFITDELRQYAQFVSFCPEDLVFGDPRASLRLVRQKEAVILQSNKDGTDLTDRLLRTSQDDLDTIKEQPLSAIIFRSKLPNCGLNSAKAYLPNGFAEGKTDGLFAALCKEQFPLLPMEEESHLNDPWVRENFIMQLFAYDDFESFRVSSPTMNALVDLHQSYKFMLQAKDETAYRQMGRLVGNQDKKEMAILLQEYEILFKTTIAKKSSVKKTHNVLEHMVGFIKNDVSSIEKATLYEQIRDFTAKIIPLITPLSTLSMFAKKYNNTYLLGQKFLQPYPKELALRSDIKSGK